MFKYKICFAFFLFAFSSFAQTDTAQHRGTIKVSLYSDSTYVKAIVEFHVFNSFAGHRPFVYGNFLLWGPGDMAIGESNRTKIIVAGPNVDSVETFNYTSYFESNEFTKGIKMRKGERETVRLNVFVNKKGKVRFDDASPIEKKGDLYLVYDDKKKEYKIDVAHKKTQKAFEKLASQKWKPALIQELKTHPSKRKNKYKISKGFTLGQLIVIYSSTPFEE